MKYDLATWARFLADLATIAIAVVLILSATDTITLH